VTAAVQVLAARLMESAEVDIIIDYFHRATPEFLNTLGVDPAKLPDPGRWRTHHQQEFSLPLEKRKSLLVLWLAGSEPIGFSTADKIKLGDEAHMHLHITRPEKRSAGAGAELVKQTARIYFDTLKIRRLFCEPYALNTAPNRTLQRAGFTYIKTYETIPGPLNFHQAVTRWRLERPPL
jgi:RimJ/RimL family protein N-acetyltransferase